MIEVRIAHDMLDRAGHETLVGDRITKSLREAGIPAMGFFALTGVRNGVLMMFEHAELGVNAHILRWREDPEDTQNNFRQVKKLKTGALLYLSGRHLSQFDDDEL